MSAKVAIVEWHKPNSDPTLVIQGGTTLERTEYPLCQLDERHGSLAVTSPAGTVAITVAIYAHGTWVRGWYEPAT